LPGCFGAKGERKLKKRTGSYDYSLRQLIADFANCITRLWLEANAPQNSETPQIIGVLTATWR
jgi:hypothetical protein